MSNLFNEYSFLLAPFCAGILVLSTHIVLGVQVVKRGIVFIDIALAQIAALGVVVANLLGWSHGWQIQLCALISGLCGALVLGKLEKHTKNYQEAFIGIAFVVAATMAILLLANSHHGMHSMHDILVGQILWVDWPQLFYPLLISIVILVIYCVKASKLQGYLFYTLFTLAVTASVQLVGVYLVFASLIIPALLFIHTANKILVFIIAIASYASGLLLSLVTDLPSGALIVCMMAVLAVCYYTINNLKKKYTQ